MFLSSDNLVLYVAATILIFILLFLLGVLGRRAFKKEIRRLNKWLSHDAELIIPLDPYKPLDQALKEGLKNTGKPRARWRNILLVVGFTVSICVAASLVSVLLAILAH